jgi:alkaline phosphatase D
MCGPLIWRGAGAASSEACKLKIINRRQTLQTLTGGAAGAAISSTSGQAQGRAAFAYGVAAGDPSADGFVIWTHAAAGAGDPVALRWQVSTDPDFKRIVARGRVTARSVRDHTAKVEVGGLKSGAAYYYRFLAGGAVSATGQARTLPRGPIDDLVLVHCCCAMYAGGHFNAYEAIAALERLDAVIHLGDYIYEVAGEKPGDYGYDTGLALGRLPRPPGACVTLADYRARFAQTRSDPLLQAAHARAAWICCWDDHDLANDDWKDGAQAHNSATDGPFSARKEAAVQAYYEWMPIRDPAPRAGFYAINKHFDFGDLASFTLLETRLTARDQQLTYGRELPKQPDGAPDVAAFNLKLKDPTRRMISAAQELWLAGALNASVKSGKPWQLIGSGVTVARVRAPDLKSQMTPEGWAALNAHLAGYYKFAVADYQAKSAFDLPFALDSWDGYPAARARLYNIIRATRARCVVLSGDSHLAWVNDLHDDAGRRIAAEFGATALTSGGLGDALLPGTPIGQAFAARNPEVTFLEAFQKGFMLTTITRQAVTCSVMGVSTVQSRTYGTAPIKTFVVTHEGETVSGPVEV